MEVAARYLGARPRTRWELERRLRRAGAEDAVVERTVERLAALGYVDDRAFARWWAEQRDRHSPRGRRMVEAELRQHGVPREIIEELRGAELAEPALDHHGLPASEDERALAALDRHLRGPADAGGPQGGWSASGCTWSGAASTRRRRGARSASRREPA